MNNSMKKQESGNQRSNEGILSEELLGKQKQLNILHNGEYYTLRITANNKLILTK